MSAATFTVFNYQKLGMFPLTGYSLPFEQFSFVADFTLAPPDVSDRKVIWNFGDGTMSTKLTGSHWYRYPGKYNVTLTTVDVIGNTSFANTLSTINIVNFLKDEVILTVDGDLNLVSGQTSTPINLTRFNSWNTSLSNTVINLAVSGNQSPFFDQASYSSDKYAHLYSTSRFEVNDTVVDSLTTTNVPVYTTVNGVSYFVGSSGTAEFFYVEDVKI